MHRVDTPDRDVNKFGSGKDGYKDGVPPGAASTSTNAVILDSFQEEIVRTVEAGGEAPDKTDLGQMIDSVRFFVSLGALQNLTKRTDTGSDITSIAADLNLGDGIVIMGNDTNGQRSTDFGLTWSSITPQAQSTAKVAHGNSQYIAVGSGGTNIQSSTNGVTWVTENTGTGTGNDVIWDGTIGLWCVVGDDTGSWIVTSPDGLAWTVRAAAGSNTFNGVATNGTVFVAVGEGGAIETSTDGINWTARTAAGSYVGGFNDIVWTGKVFVAVGDATASDGEVQTSPDGITWTSRTSVAGVVGDMFVVENVGGVIVSTRSDGTMMHTHGNCGGAWVPGAGLIVEDQVPAAMQGIAYLRGRAIIVATNNDIHTSELFIGA